MANSPPRAGPGEPGTAAPGQTREFRRAWRHRRSDESRQSTPSRARQTFRHAVLTIARSSLRTSALLLPAMPRCASRFRIGTSYGRLRTGDVRKALKVREVGELGG